MMRLADAVGPERASSRLEGAAGPPQEGPVKGLCRRLFEVAPGGHRNRSMEGLRGLSALLVFFVHFYAIFGLRAPSAQMRDFLAILGRLGNCGVDVFFAISGYVIYSSLLGKPFQYGDFLRRRVVRIYPVFLVVFSIYLALNSIYRIKPLGSNSLEVVQYLAGNLLLLPGVFPIAPLITVAWSLSYEFYFYLTIPLLVWSLQSRSWPWAGRVAAILGCCAAGFLLNVYAELHLSRMLMFGAGMLAREIPLVQLSARWRQIGGVLATLAFLLALISYGILPESDLGRALRLLLTFPGNLTLLFLSTTTLAYFTLRVDGFLSAWFQWDWIRWFGNISFSYYLTHGLGLEGLNLVLRSLGSTGTLSLPLFLILWAAAFGVTALAGTALFLLVEKPFSLRQPAKTRGPAIDLPLRKPIRPQTVSPMDHAVG